MRALVVEDDPALREQVCRHLSDEGYAVDSAADGEQGQYMAVEYPLDIAIIDLGLPKTPGIAIIKAVRKAGRSYPILILTARDGWQSKVEGLEAGKERAVAGRFQVHEGSLASSRLRAAMSASLRAMPAFISATRSR